MKVDIELIKKQNEKEKKFVETGEYDESDQELCLMMGIYKANNAMDYLRNLLKVEVAKNNQTINFYENNIETMRENAVKNAGMQSKDLRKLEGVFKNRTVIVCAFGPSLMKNIEHLKKIKNKYQIIAVDRAMKYLYENGIIADYYITVDPNSRAEWIPRMNLKGTRLLSIIGGSFEFNNRFFQLGGDVCLFNSIDRIGIWSELMDIAGDMPYLSCSGNVAHAGLMASLYLFQSKKTLLLGFDNSWNEYYYPDILADSNKESVQKENILGEKVKTNPEFLSYNYYMTETIMQKENIDKVVNCSEGGILKIKNIEKLEKY